MSDEKHDAPVDEEELEKTNGELLPDREAMSIIAPTPGEELWTTPVEKPGI